MGVSQQFKNDLQKARKAERLVRLVLQELVMQNIESEEDYDNMMVFNDVADNPQYYHRGDIECHDKLWGINYYIDVKDDGCISRTGNFLAEHAVYFKNSKQKVSGFMQANYDYVAYVSQPEKKFYILDFKLWQKEYKDGRYITIEHPEQITYAFLMSVEKAKKKGIVMAEIGYEEDEGDNQPHPIHTEIYRAY